MKVVHLINHLGLGGAERFVVELVKAFPRDGFDIEVLCLYRTGELAKEVKEIGIPVEVIRIPRKFGMSGYLRVFRALWERHPDILHCHLLESCWYGLPAGWFAHIPVRIAHLHNCYWNLRLKLRVFDRLAFQFANAAFGCSEAVLRFYRERMWYPRSKLHLVYNAVDPRRFTLLPRKLEVRRSLGLQEESLIVTTVASLTPQKGHEYLLKAVPKITASCPEVQFLFVGDGELRDQLKAQARELGIDSRVTFLGKRTDVPEILRASDLFVLPSLWEGLPIVLIEAGLAGLPVVASRVDGVVEVVEEGRSGLLVPPKDVEALAEGCLQLLLGNPDLRARMGREGQRIALERFSNETAAKRVAELYKDLLKAKGRWR